MFHFGLNTSTIAGQGLSVVDQILLAGRCGYDGIEVWMRSLDEHVAAGGTPAEVASAAEASGVVIENVIGFVPWAVDDSATRESGLSDAVGELEMLEAIGCRRLAAPPFGAVDEQVGVTDLAERFDALADICAHFGVTPQLELWGFSATLGTLDEVRQVADAATTRPVKLLLDAYHLFRGGSAHQDLASLDGGSLDVFHLNDFPTDRPRHDLSDADRVLPGDGTGPVGEIIRLLASMAAPPVLSIELFNRELWQQPAEQVASIALERMRSAVDSALAAPAPDAERRSNC